MATVAALARRGHRVTLLMPRGAGDPVLTADDLRRHFAVEGDFRLVQRESRRSGEKLVSSALWLRRVFADPLAPEADVLLSRIPALLGFGRGSPVRFALDHYRPWPDDWPWLRPLIRRTAASPKCLGFILHSDFAAESYRRAGIEDEQILVAHNGGAASAGADVIARAEARTALKLSGDAPIVAYAGRVNREKGLDQYLALAALRPKVQFLLIGSEGDGPIEAEFARIPNVRVVGWQDKDGLDLWLAAADVLAIPAASAPLARFRNCVLPIKTFRYLAAGRPILAPAAPDTAELLRHGENAWLVPPDVPAAAAAALDRLTGDPALAARLSAGALASAAALTWDARAEKIERFLEARLD